MCLKTSALKTQQSQPDSPVAVTVAVLLSFKSKAISPKPIIYWLEQSSFSMVTFSWS